MVSMTNDYDALKSALEQRHSPDEAGSSLDQLLNVRLTVQPRLLETTLEALAQADFPINPQLTHQRQTLIEFPAYRAQLKQLDALLRGLPVEISARNMLDEIRTPDPGRSPVLAN